MMNKMRYSHWELMQLIHQDQHKHRVFKHQYNKNLLKTCVNNGWIEIYDDKYVRVTDKGLQDANMLSASLKTTEQIENIR